MQTLMALEDIEGVQVKIVQDEAGRAIFRARIQIDPQKTDTDAQEIARKLKDGDIAIYTRDYGVRQGYFDIDPRPLGGDDITVIEAKIRELLEGK